MDIESRYFARGSLRTESLAMVEADASLCLPINSVKGLKVVGHQIEVCRATKREVPLLAAMEETLKLGEMGFNKLKDSTAFLPLIV